jgi:hypothetical protein
VRVRGAFGRKRLRHSQRELALRHQIRKRLQRGLVSCVVTDLHAVDRDVALGLAFPAADHGIRATVFDRGEDRSAEQRGIQQRINAGVRQLPQPPDYFFPSGDEVRRAEAPQQLLILR